MLESNKTGGFPYTPATNLLYGLREALHMLQEEGLPNVFARHARHGEATRRAVSGWGLELVALDPREYSDTVTAILVPDGFDADALRATILERFDMSLGTGLGRSKARRSASATSARSTTSCWREPCAACRWGSSWPGSRTAKASRPALGYLTAPAGTPALVTA